MEMIILFETLIIIVLLVGWGMSIRRHNIKIRFATALYDENNVLYDMLKMDSCGESLKRYFEANGYKNIAIVGLGKSGKCLISLLQKEGIDIAYATEWGTTNWDYTFDVICPENPLLEADIAIVTNKHMKNIDKIIGNNEKIEFVYIRDLLSRI